MPEPFKNLYDEAWVHAAGRRIGSAAGVDPGGLARRVLPALLDLELKARVDLLADALADWLPGSFPQQVEALLSTLGPPADLSRKNQFDMGCWPLTSFVQRHGLHDFDTSMRAIHALTQRFSGEFAVRPFLARQPEQTLALFETWTADPSPHVRRLVSEGSRPRLPWGERLRAFQQDPTPTLALLERLRADPHEYVRRSVANHLGDVAKDHPDRAVAVVRRWLSEAPSAEMTALARHALRHPVKLGHPGALAALGLDLQAEVALLSLQASSQVVLGEALEVDLVLRSASPVEVEVDLVLHLRKANGQRSPKVFKGGRLALQAGQERAWRKRLPLRPVTTRRYHGGLQRVEVQVNGRVLGGAEFELVVPEAPPEQR